MEAFDKLKKSPMFSVVMPIYNMEQYLEQAIECIRKQNYQDYELILVNDASLDNSLKICQRKKDEKTVIVNLKENRGLSGARNAGFEHAKGEYVLFLDPDDTYSDTLLKDLNDQIKKNNSDLLVYGVIEEYFDKNGKLEYSKKICPHPTVLTDKKSIYEKVLKLESQTLFGYAWNKCFKRSLIKTHRYIKIKMIEDVCFNLEILPEIKSLQVLNITPYHYKIRQNASLTHQVLPEYLDLHLRRITSFIEVYKKEMPDLLEICYKTIAPIYCRYLLSSITRIGKENVRKQLENAFSSTLYRDLYPYMHFDIKKELIYKPIIMKNINLCILDANFVRFVKDKMPGIFAKLKQIR